MRHKICEILTLDAFWLKRLQELKFERVMEGTNEEEMRFLIYNLRTTESRGSWKHFSFV
jgi:hypothetical protein